MSKRQEMQKRRQKEKKQRKMITLGAIIIGAGLTAAALIYPSLNNNTETHTRYMAENNMMGNPDAPIKIVEYSSYKCGHCAAFAFETEPLLEEEYVKTGKVHFTSIAIWDEISAEASYCAGEQDKYWEMHDIIFTNQAMPFDENIMAKWAKSIDDMDVNKFKDCMAKGTYADRVTQDNEDSRTVGVEATPSFLISYLVDGELVEKLLVGNVPYEEFQYNIEKALEAIGG